ncbi:NAD(P)/FAD-dependent oxidoreductase [Streptomyces gilvifuscus]|uniref:NAD(P)/FAD-dependent oxidoreductase n=1 Tax=Streptomyces gilvifuscus TaxID=1550617 RepID=A0ABT5FYM6_9ACTN|nr:NAD(P)/FAD-dependent oxidoreductase [Streptomyces gilvifuscus]MDC2957659.1 NAD(P)/FAD-dependent oxidoreductase [Streptomyces gilvifuscus]
MLDAVVVGAGPNGLTAAVELARRGFSVAVFEARGTVGGGARTEELTLPGFRHDPCSAAHPLGINSPAFRALPLERYGLKWLHAELPMAHPFLDGTAAVLSRSVAETAASFGSRDAGAYRRLVAPFLSKWDTLTRDFMSLPLTALPRDPVTLARFGLAGLPPSTWLTRRFHDEPAKTLFAGLVAHVMAPLSGVATGAIGLVFALAAHARGWPVAEGGSQSISDALTAYLKDLGGLVHTDYEVKRLDDLPPARAYVFDTSPTALARIAGFGRYYENYKYGPGVFKIDYALDGPVPWTAEPARAAGTVQIGADSKEIGTALRAASREGRAPDRPFMITVQPGVVDPTRAPEGKHVFWAYAHVPSGWTGDLTDVMERQLERFAPGFRDRVLARATAGPAELAAHNANYVGGDIGTGAVAGLQTLLRPRLTLFPYHTPHPAIFICSSATPPGPGVHGMSGHNAAKAVWRRLRQTG